MGVKKVINLGHSSESTLGCLQSTEDVVRPEPWAKRSERSSNSDPK